LSSFLKLNTGFEVKTILKAIIPASLIFSKSVSKASSPCQAGIIKLCLISFKVSHILSISSSIEVTKLVHHTGHLGQDGTNLKQILNNLSAHTHHQPPAHHHPSAQFQLLFQDQTNGLNNQSINHHLSQVNQKILNNLFCFTLSLLSFHKFSSLLTNVLSLEILVILSSFLI
jgi:hypothetical protein